MRTKIIITLGAISFVLNCLGCANTPKTASAPITAQTASHIVATGGYLSEIDDKASSIKALLK